ncbi:MAG: Mycothione reductase [Acidimicrobiales bacterium]|nr:MAG: mycothione reductase [Actinomycetota bacterium]MBV6507246.1 Mycothione reductase [Acidimicrobiales bacterium]RIK05473.1 MAG: mycothione reductase [Acidobacteriota bacterium]
MPHFDLMIIGTGSGNTILGPEFDDWDVAIVERDAFGGTCLNRGCVPSKMLVYPADLVEAIRHSSRLGVEASLDKINWPEIRARVFDRIDPIAVAGEEYRRRAANVSVFAGSGRFVAPRALEVDEQVLTADRVVIAAGARPFVPPVEGLDRVGFHTSDTIMRIRQIPERLVILGGGYISAEMAHVFDSFGSSVSIVNRSNVLLRAEDEDVSRRFTEAYRGRLDLLLGMTARSVEQDDAEITVELAGAEGTTAVTADALLVAMGRVPNSDQLEVTAADVEVDDKGYVLVDETMATTAPGVWALGDVCNPMQLKHVANLEAKVVRHNLLNPDNAVAADYTATPHAIFASPQVASVGYTEQELRARGLPHVTSCRDYAETAYGWAMEDTTGFCKVIADPGSGTLLGAHILGPQASTLIQQVVQGMRFGLTVEAMARDVIYTHPALPEVVEQALVGLL